MEEPRDERGGRVAVSATMIAALLHGLLWRDRAVNQGRPEEGTDQPPVLGRQSKTRKKSWRVHGSDDKTVATPPPILSSPGGGCGQCAGGI